MTEFVEKLLKQLKDKSYRTARTRTEEKPTVYPLDLFGFHFGANLPQKCGEGNLTPNYEKVLSVGFAGLREELVRSMERTKNEAKRAYGMQMLKALDECLADSEELKQQAAAVGNLPLCQALERVPAHGAESFYQACVTLQATVYFLRRSGVTHLGLGRFDQYMYPYFMRDLEIGIPEERLFELLEGFFISLNYDSDLYYGMQQGDNGQSMVLGGYDPDGTDRYNRLSELCLHASLELNLIDPKINLRVGKSTPDERYVLGTRLTKQGLGFPQYCNDDVVIPGLINLGYAPEDAQNYVVAACWEHIIPAKGADYPNLKTMNFPRVVTECLRTHLLKSATFDALMEHVCHAIEDECELLAAMMADKKWPPQPLLSVFTDGCIDSLTDLWAGGTKYFNFGCHGAGIANAADALMAVKQKVYEEKSIAPALLLEALERNFRKREKIRNALLECPKMGNNNDEVDHIAACLMDCFAKSMNHRPNNHGGIWRAGTGSAMEYLSSAKRCGATADGRGDGEPYSSSFSPAPAVKPSGLLSVILSFTKFDMTKIINGGPLTLEIHDTVLRNEIGIQKTAQLVKQFILRGGHQLQLNSINRERLLDAQQHPERYPNLIVRVWGWSGYFNELDRAYQDHIICRTEYLG